MININATFLVELVSFSVLVLFTRRFIWPALNNILTERRSKIEDQLRSFQTQEEFVLASKKESERIINEAKAQALKVIEDTKMRCLDLTYEAKQQAEIIKQQIIENGRMSAILEVQKINEQLLKDSIARAKDYAEIILKRQISQEDDENLIQDLINKI